MQSGIEQLHSFNHWVTQMTGPQDWQPPQKPQFAAGIWQSVESHSKHIIIWNWTNGIISEKKYSISEYHISWWRGNQWGWSVSLLLPCHRRTVPTDVGWEVCGETEVSESPRQVSWWQILFPERSSTVLFHLTRDRVLSFPWGKPDLHPNYSLFHGMPKERGLLLLDLHLSTGCERNQRTSPTV